MPWWIRQPVLKAKTTLLLASKQPHTTFRQRGDNAHSVGQSTASNEDKKPGLDGDRTRTEADIYLASVSSLKTEA